MIVDTRAFRPDDSLPANVRKTPRTDGSVLVFTLLLAGIGATTPANAEISIEPSVQGGMRYDTNPHYHSSLGDSDSAWGSIFDVRLPMEYSAPRFSASLAPRLVYSFYPDSKDARLEDRDNYLTGAVDRTSRRSSIGAGYGYTDLAMRTSEFDEAGNSSSGGSGETNLARDTQQRWFFQPVWQYQLSWKNSVTLNAGYEEVRYDEKFLSRRFDYDYANVGTAVEHAFNNRHALSLQARFTKFDAENKDTSVNNDSETTSLSLVYTYLWSEKTRLSADLGWAQTKNEVRRPNNIDPVTGLFCDPALIAFFPCEFKSDSSNFVGNLTATRQSETVEYRVVFGQSITPNSNGAEVLRFNIDATARKQFTERFSGRLEMLAFTQDDVGDSDRNFERDYIRGKIVLRYRFARNWSVYGNYRITYNKEKNNLLLDRTIRNHFVSVGVRFEGDGWRW